MRTLFRPFILGLIGLVILAGIVLFFNTSHPFLDSIVGPASFLYQRINFVSRVYDRVSNLSGLAQEAQNLEAENLLLLSRLADYDRLSDENESLRRALNLPVFGSTRLFDAQVSLAGFSPQGHELLLNRGSSDSIDVGYVVVAPEGFLIGIVSEVGLNYSRVALIINPDIEIAVKNIDSNVSGIARGALSEGMVLDFVSQNDEINPGDLLVTNGSDQYPPGLVVGKVSSVLSPAGSLFKDIKVTTFMQENKFDYVILIEP